MGVHVPLLLAEHALADAEQKRLAKEVDGRPIGGDIAEHLHFAQIVHHDRVEAMVTRDLEAGVEGALEGTRVDRVDPIGGETHAHEPRLFSATLTQLRVECVADGPQAGVGDVLLAMAHKDQFSHVFDVREERAVEHHRSPCGAMWWSGYRLGHGSLRDKSER